MTISIHKRMDVTKYSCKTDDTLNLLLKVVINLREVTLVTEHNIAIEKSSWMQKWKYEVFLWEPNENINSAKLFLE